MEDVGRELCLTSLDQFGLYIETESGERRCIMSEEYILDVLRLTLPDAKQQQQQHQQQQASQKRVVLCKQRAHFFIAHKERSQRVLLFFSSSPEPDILHAEALAACSPWTGHH